jgi:sugar diacid utilization regulator
LLASAGAAAGLALSISEQEPEPGRVRAAPVRVDGHLEGWIAAAPGAGGALGGDDALGAELSVYLAAASAGRVLGREARERELPVRSREDVLSELLLATPSEHPRLVQRARAIGLPIDGWHVVVELDVEELRDDDGDQLSAYAARSEFGRSMLSGARIDGGTWHTARAGAAILLLRSYPQDPGVGAPGEVASSMDRVLARVRPRTAAATVRCGVGTAHAGGRGVLASAAEARAATTSARAGGRVNAALPFDSVGLRRALVEWYASDVAQDAVSTILQPLRDLGGGRGERLIQTLHVYLDQQRSLTRTGAVLHLHRNAVAYRIKQIFGLLDVDPENADDVLLLQLACRARGLS